MKLRVTDWKMKYIVNIFVGKQITTVELRYKVTKGTEYFVSSERSLYLNEECDILINSREWNGV